MVADECTRRHVWLTSSSSVDSEWIWLGVSRTSTVELEWTTATKVDSARWFYYYCRFLFLK